MADDRTLGNPELPAAFVRLLSAATGRLTPAAVLIALTEAGEGTEVLLTRRTEHLKHHAGQISFPGGAREPQDESLEATALREAHEEVGLGAEQVELVGRMSPYLTVTGYRVTPVVGLVSADYALCVDPEEVAEAFTVPLEFFRDPANLRRYRRVVKGFKIPVFEFHYGERVIWGATAGMLVNLVRALAPKT